ncbi:MAG: C-GCAxxG-C-C family protein [Lachnospiraceae bacterium]|nr:C-GCAxxG-C-C family protein [Lachnospiraceae bacterium]
MLEESPRAQLAIKYFYEGYNCSQAIMLAFEDVHGMDRRTALTMSCSFGGGMGRLREVCGGVSGIFMVLGLLYGYDDPRDSQAKKEQYERVQELATDFAGLHGSIVCRDLLGIKEKGPQPPTPEARTPEYYKKRPCPKMIGSAAMILEGYLQKHPV